MNPSKAKLFRRYAAFHATLGNPTRATYRQLKQAVQDARLSGAQRHALYKRVALLTAKPFFAVSDGSVELRMVGLQPEREALAKLRRAHQHQRPEEGPWRVRLPVPPDVRAVLNIPLAVNILIPLG